MKEKVNVTGVPETMVQTLYARAKETRKKNAKINDEIAVELVKKNHTSIFCSAGSQSC